MENRWLYCLGLSLLALGTVQVAKPWQQFIVNPSHREGPRSVGSEVLNHAQPSTTRRPTVTPFDSLPLIENVPDQGRPRGRLRGGGSR